MKRIAAGFALALLLLPVGVAAKVVTVTNPMSGFLDGAGYSIGNVNAVTTTSGASINGVVVTGDYIDVHDPAGQVAPQIRSGTAAPSLGLVGRTGSLYLRDDLAGHGQLWLKVGPLATDWTCIAGCAP